MESSTDNSAHINFELERIRKHIIKQEIKIDNQELLINELEQQLKCLKKSDADKKLKFDSIKKHVLKQETIVGDQRRTISEMEKSLDFAHKQIEMLILENNEVKKHMQASNKANEQINLSLANLTSTDVSQEDRLDYLSDKSRRKNLIFTDVPEIARENFEQTEKKILDLISKHLKLSPVIERVHRVNGKIDKNVKPRNIIVKFQSLKQRDQIFKRRNELKNHVGVFEDLCPGSVEERKKQVPKLIRAREEGKIAYFSRRTLIIKSKPTPNHVSKQSQVLDISTNNESPRPLKTQSTKTTNSAIVAKVDAVAAKPARAAPVAAVAAKVDAAADTTADTTADIQSVAVHTVVPATVPAPVAKFDNDIDPIMSPIPPSSLPTNIEGASPFMVTAVGGACIRRLSLPVTPTSNRSLSLPRIASPKDVEFDVSDQSSRVRTRANSFAMQSLKRTATITADKQPIRRSLREPRILRK